MSETSTTPVADDLVRTINEFTVAEFTRLNAANTTLDIMFLAYLRHVSRFGFFTFGPVSIDVQTIEEIVERTTVRRAPGVLDSISPFSDDYVRFSEHLMLEVRNSGRRRIDELHFLLAFMRVGEGLPARVFGELGVTPEQVEQYARTRSVEPPSLEKLYSPEQAAEYLDVHVQTVRAWIRSGRLRARRLAGQRALRITSSDLMSVLEPIEPEDAERPAV